MSSERVAHPRVFAPSLFVFAALAISGLRWAPTGSTCSRSRSRGHHRRRLGDAGRLCPLHHPRDRRDDGDRRLWRGRSGRARQGAFSRCAGFCHGAGRHCGHRAGGARGPFPQPQSRDGDPGFSGGRDNRAAREQGPDRRRRRPQRPAAGHLRVSFSGDAAFLLLCGVLAAIIILPMAILLEGPFGKNLRAVASNENAARAFGINVRHHLIAAFAGARR